MLFLLCIIGVYLVVPVSGVISASEGIRSGTTTNFVQMDNSSEVMDIGLLVTYASVLATNVTATVLIGVKLWSVKFIEVYLSLINES